MLWQLGSSCSSSETSKICKWNRRCFILHCFLLPPDTQGKAIDPKRSGLPTLALLSPSSLSCFLHLLLPGSPWGSASILFKRWRLIAEVTSSHISLKLVVILFEPHRWLLILVGLFVKCLWFLLLSKSRHSESVTHRKQHTLLWYSLIMCKRVLLWGPWTSASQSKVKILHINLIVAPVSSFLNVLLWQVWQVRHKDKAKS